MSFKEGLSPLDWKTDVQNATRALNITRRQCYEELEAIDESSRVSRAFLTFIDAVSQDLPEWLLFRIERPRDLKKSLQDYLGSFTRGNKDLARIFSPREVRRYFLPKPHEIYNFNLGGFFQSTPPNYLPEASDFVGFEELRKIEGYGQFPLKGVILERVYTQGAQKVGFYRVKEIASAVEETMGDGVKTGRKRTFRYNKLQETIQACQRGQDIVLGEFGFQIRGRILNLRDAVLRSPYGCRLPAIISDIPDTHDPKDEKRYYFLVQEGRLVTAPTIIKKQWLGKPKEELDLSKAEDVSSVRWYGLADYVEMGLVDPLPPGWALPAKI